MARFANSAELVRELDDIFATKTLADWGEVFDRENVWWAPVQHAHDLSTTPRPKPQEGSCTCPTPLAGTRSAAADPSGQLYPPPVRSYTRACSSKMPAIRTVSVSS